MTVTTKRPWVEVAKERPNDPAAHYAALAWAHLQSFHDAIEVWTGKDNPGEADHEPLRLASREHMPIYAAAFTAAAFIKGWALPGIEEALADGQVAAEYLWEWLGPDVDPETIAPAGSARAAE